MIGIVGGRDRIDKKHILTVIGQFVRDGDRIVSGGAIGADSFAEEYARNNKLEFKKYLPGSVPQLKNETPYTARNRKIAEECEVLLAFPSRESRGTWNTIMLALHDGKRVAIFEEVDVDADKSKPDRPRDD